MTEEERRTLAHAKVKGIVGATVVMAAAALVLMAVTASAQERTEDCSAVEAMPGAVAVSPASYGAVADTIAIAPDGQGFLLCYANHERHVSSTETHNLIVGDFSVRVSIVVSGGDNSGERMTIAPPPGWAVFPADDADVSVPDGAAVTVLLFSGLM